MTPALTATPELAPTSTPGHTIGPFFHDAMRWADNDHVADHPAQGSIHIEGSVEDGSDEKIPAWLLEAWVPQSVAAETAAGLQAPGLRRVLNDPRGVFSFRVPAPAAGQPAAFITLFGLGLSRHHYCAVFLDDASAQTPGSMLATVPAERRATLIAERIDEGHYRWTIRTQGERETVFFDYR